MGINPQTVSNWERGVAFPTPFQNAMLEVFSSVKGQFSDLLAQKGGVKTLAFILDSGLKLEFPSKKNS